MRLIRKLGGQLREYTVPVVVALRAALLSSVSTTSPRFHPSLAARLYAVVTITVNHLRRRHPPWPDVTSQSSRCNGAVIRRIVALSEWSRRQREREEENLEERDGRV